MDFLVMEFLDGETLERRLEKGPLPPAQTVRYGAQIANALAKAHKLGITHRDLKPANVMLTKAGAKLLDFGLAKQAGAANGCCCSRYDIRAVEIDERRDDRWDIPIHGAGAVGRKRSGCTHRHFCARRSHL